MDLIGQAATPALRSEPVRTSQHPQHPQHPQYPQYPQRPPRPGQQPHGRLWCALTTMLMATVAALSVTALGGCGGGGEAGEAPAAAGTAAPAQKTTVDFGLESDYGPGDAPGSAMRFEVADSAELGDASAAPVDRQARTQRGRYVSRSTAERFAQESGEPVVWVDATCCTGLDPELPERIAFGMQAVLGDDARLFVTGSELRKAARLADRLDTLGTRHVYLVTP